MGVTAKNVRVDASVLEEVRRGVVISCGDTINKSKWCCGCLRINGDRVICNECGAEYLPNQPNVDYGIAFLGSHVFVCEVKVAGHPFAVLSQSEADDWVKEDPVANYYTKMKVGR